MKREIKFRGKSIDSGEWVYGDLIQLDTQLCIAGVHQWAGVPANNSIEIDVTKIIPETFGQFTGMKDKSGKEVYEGDIVRFCDDHPYCSDYIVKYDEERLMWIADGVGDFMEDLWELDEDYVEVIGNIYDNAELLNDK